MSAEAYALSAAAAVAVPSRLTSVPSARPAEMMVIHAAHLDLQ